MGAWDVQPWDNDTAADWFAGFFSGIDFDSRIVSAFEEDDEYDEIRAASYILQTLGRIYVWPGDVNKLGSHLDLALRHLRNMVDPDHEACQELQELWGSDSAVFDSIRTQITELEQRRSEGNWETTTE